MGVKENVNCTLTETAAAKVFLQIVMVTEMLLGLPGAILALWIFCCRMKGWKSHVVFLFNLVFADFLLLISVPFRIDTHWRGGDWIFGSIWCRLNLYMLSANRSASLGFMTVVALDRYFKVVHPHNFISQISPTHATRLAGLIWVLVLSIHVPLLTTELLQEQGNKNVCRSFNSYDVIPLPLKVHYLTYILEFIIPWLLLLFCSARVFFQLRKLRMNRKKVQRAIRVMAVITVVFTFCFMPSVFTGLVGLYIRSFHPSACTSQNAWNNLFMVGIGLTYLNSALDPVIYFFSSSMFQQILKNSINLKPTSKALSTLE